MAFSTFITLPQTLPSSSLISALNHPTNLHFRQCSPNRPLSVDRLRVGPIARSHARLATRAKAGSAGLSTGDGDDFPAGLRQEEMPGHVAFILDGNRRWAEHKGFGCDSGHAAGLKALLGVMGLCANWGINVATFFLFSSENWRRPKQEVDFVMWSFENLLLAELENIQRQGIRISTIGDTSKLPNSLQKVIEHTKEATQDNTKTHVIFAISYSGKNDCVQACRSLATKVRDGLVEPNEITESLLERELETNITTNPCPDLLIRTSGEVRISNFLLWQLAYSEMFFTDTLWPDFGEHEFAEALQSFQKRGRRFGGQ